MKQTTNVRASYLIAAMAMVGGLAVSSVQAALVFDSFNLDAVSNSPQSLPVFTLAAERKITEIVNYHWYFGSGADPSGNTISITDVGPGGSLVGSWPASWDGRGLPNTYWLAYPDIVLGPGTYQISDSGRATWSFSTTNFFNGAGPDWVPGIGMTQVSGEVVVPEPAAGGLALATLACAVSGRRRR